MLWTGGIVIVVLGFAFALSLLGTKPAAGVAIPLPPVTADDHVKGAENGRVTVVEYLDLECAACAAYYPLVKQMEEEFGDRVTFVVRYFPLQGHINGYPAALAAEAASRQGKFWEMHDLLFENQKEWGGKQSATPEVFETYAQKIGLNMEQFKTDFASESVKERVERNKTEARDLKLNGTPSFFLQGLQIASPPSPEAFRALIQAELDRTAS